MWSLTAVTLFAVFVCGVLAWHHATRIDRQAGHESCPRQSGPDAALGLALAALVAAVAAATVLQLTFLPRIVH
jgi:4-hydroxybenzoate polyprenyltransferase